MITYQLIQKRCLSKSNTTYGKKKRFKKTGTKEKKNRDVGSTPDKGTSIPLAAG